MSESDSSESSQRTGSRTGSRYAASWSAASGSASSSPQQVPRARELSSSNTRKGPSLQITVQPQTHSRFRYKSEKKSGTHGCLLGKAAADGSKRFPTVQLLGYTGKANITCELKPEDSEKEHPHQLQDNVKGRCLVIEVSKKDGYTAIFEGIGIIHTAKKDVEDFYLQTYGDEDDCKQLANNVNLDAVRLKFSATDAITGAKLCSVLSEPIYNEKSVKTNKLQIVRFSRTCGRPEGKEDVYIFTGKISKNNTQVRFFQINEDGVECWTDLAKFSESEVHRQCAIFCSTPPYRDLKITKDVKVYVELKRTSDGMTSNRIEFTYKPSQFHNSKKRKLDGPSTSNVASDVSTTTPATITQVRKPSSDVSSIVPSALTPNFGQNFVQPTVYERPVVQTFSNPRLESGVFPSYPAPLGQAPPTGLGAGHTVPQRYEVFNSQSSMQGQDTAPYYSNSQVPYSTVHDVNSENMMFDANMPMTVDAVVSDTGNLDSIALLASETVASSSTNHGDTLGAGGLERPPANVMVLADTLQQAGLDSTAEDFNAFIIQDIDCCHDTNMECPDLDALFDLLEPESGLTKLMTDSGVKKECKTILLDTSKPDFQEAQKLLRDINHNMKEGASESVVQRALEQLCTIELPNGDKCLHTMISNNPEGFKELVKLIHKFGLHDFLELPNKLSQNVLHCAILAGRPCVVTCLLETGMSPMLEDNEGNNAIHYAVMSQKCLEEILEAIKTNNITCDLDEFNFEKQTALHMAALYNLEQSARLLLQHGASVKVYDSEGRSPLHLAVYHDNYGVARALLDHAHPDVIDATDRSGMTALQIACSRGVQDNTLDIVKLLVEKKADPWKRSEDGPGASSAAEIAEANALLLAALGVSPSCSRCETPDEYHSADEGNLAAITSKLSI